MAQEMTARQFLDALPMGASLKRISPDSDWVLSRANGDIGHYASVDDLLARIADEGREAARDRVTKAALIVASMFTGERGAYSVSLRELLRAVDALQALESESDPSKLPCGCRGKCRGDCRGHPPMGAFHGGP